MMPQMNITITNIFTTPDKFVTVKSINILIEISIFTPKTYQGFHANLSQINLQTRS